MITIDWYYIRKQLPIYAYEYETVDEKGNVTDYKCWRPGDAKNKGQEPPPGWTNIAYDDSHPELWREAADAWVKNVVRPNEKAVWFDMATGDFSNTFRLGELLNSTLEALDQSKIGKNELEEKTSTWRLIVYRVESGSDFEFSNLMRLVTKPREARR
uniref:Uncharacterized protein n=1 Tax=Pseudomonas phage HRDY3 TaxID=3236930 RepID=A0AB39CEV6_9VIRU